MQSSHLSAIAESTLINLLAAILFAQFFPSPSSQPSLLIFATAFFAIALVVRITRRPETRLEASLERFVPAALFSLLLFLAANFALSFVPGITAQLLPRLGISLLVAFPGVILADWAWGRLELRWRILAFVQSRSATVLVAGLVAGLAGLSVASAIALFHVTAPWLPLPIDTVAPIASSTLVFIIVSLALRLGRRPRISPGVCHDVLKRIWREGVVGESAYTLVEGTSPKLIREHCRILDFLATYRRANIVPDIQVRRRWWLYFVSARTQPWTLPPAPTASSHTKRTPAEAREQEEADYAAWIAQLATAANALCEQGARHRWWTKDGPDVQPAGESLYARAFFGSKLDSLFNGGAGYRVGGTGLSRFITMVVKGQPGAGKSTLALQLCVTLAQQGNLCLYYSLEEEREVLLQSARDFGWDQEKDPDGVRYRGIMHQNPAHYRGHLAPRIDDLYHPDDDRKGGRGKGSAKGKEGEDKGQPLRIGAVLVSSLGNRAMRVPERMAALRREWLLPPKTPLRCVVIDSIEGFANVGLDKAGIPAILRDQLLDVRSFFRDRCDILVMVAEDDGSGTPGYVDFVADTVIQLGHRDENGYVILNVEVQKARNERHALGQHQIKILSRRDLLSGAVASDPERRAGSGIIVYPSLDYILSQSRSQTDIDTTRLSSGFTGLDELLLSDRAAGLSRQSTTALIGPGSTGKSLIAMNFLIEGVRENEAALLLSLRDNEETIRRRPVPQELGRMRLAWKQGTKAAWLHELEWPITGIADWIDRLKDREGDSARFHAQLPYLFDGAYTSELSGALYAFLSNLADATIGVSWWGAAACEKIQETYRREWEEFANKADELNVSFVKVEDPKTVGSIVSQRLHLILPSDDMEGTPPALQWRSPVRLTGDGKFSGYDTHLFYIKPWRLGRITPDDFADWLLSVIGAPTDKEHPSPYGRVVFDDAAQLSERFPLLASSKLFLPSLIDLFKSRKMASLFLAGFDEHAQIQSSAGLDVLADHVIRTSRDAKSQVDVAPTATSAPARRILVDIDARPGAEGRPVYELRVKGSEKRGDEPRTAEIWTQPLSPAP